MAGRPRTLAGWLRHAERLAPRPIVLGLERVAEVWRRLGAPAVAGRVITVAGTNGKGSTVAMIEAVLRAGGRRTGAYLSPHLARYNERVRIAGEEAGDEALCRAFAAVERARGSVPLTYFEFGTLACFLLFAEAGLEVAVLEVGMGGRLDAVNLIDADVAVLTTVDLDHREFLGPDRETIGLEKAHVFRPGRPAILGEAEPPRSVLAHATAIGADPWLPGRDYAFAPAAEGWRWRGRALGPLALPRPALAAPPQVANAATALAALEAAGEGALLAGGAAAAGLAAVRLRGRLERLGAEPEIVADVAHNPQAARVLADWLRAAPRRPTFALFAALADKDAAGMAAPLAGLVEGWHLCGLERLSPRGQDAEALAARVDPVLAGQRVRRHRDPAAALRALRREVPREGRILAFGSFILVAAVMRALAAR